MESTFWIATNCNANENGTDCVQPPCNLDTAQTDTLPCRDTLPRPTPRWHRRGGAGRSRAEPGGAGHQWHDVTRCDTRNLATCNLTWIDFTRTLNSKDTKSSWWVHVYRTRHKTWTSELKNPGNKQLWIDLFPGFQWNCLLHVVRVICFARIQHVAISLRNSSAILTNASRESRRFYTILQRISERWFLYLEFPSFLFVLWECVHYFFHRKAWTCFQ